MDIKQNQLQDQQSSQQKNLSLIPQQLIMQNLTHYFMFPSNKQIPYAYYFYKHPKWFIYALSYLYNFIRANNHSKIVNQIFMKLILFEDKNNSVLNINQPKKKLIQQISQDKNQVQKYLNIIVQAEGKQNEGIISRKVLLNRYISLPSMMAQYLQSQKINSKVIEQKILTEMCYILSKLNYQQKSYLINKIIMLGYSKILIKPENQQILLETYEYIVRKDTLVFTIIREILLNQNQNAYQLKILYKILQSFQKTNYQIIVNLFNNQFFLPNHAEHLNSLLLSKFLPLNTQVLENLLIWWTEGNDHYLIYNMVKFRTNIIVLCLRNLREKQVIEYSTLISLGIEKRLMTMTQTKKQIVQLVWGELVNKLGIQIQKKFSSQLLKNDVQQQINNKQIQELAKQNNLSPLNKQSNKNLQVLEENNFELKQEQTNEQKKYSQSQILQVIPKGPRNLYDCILGLNNPARKSITLQFLPKIIRSYPDDLIFTWNDLIQQLLYNLTQETTPSVIALFVTRPQNFIQSLGQIFFKKQHSLNDKIVLMEILNEGVQQLSQRPKQIDTPDSKQSFYFKKVKSKYFNENDNKNRLKNDQEQKQDNRTRRWGHTRIAYQNRMKQSLSVSLKILNNEPYINRLYQIATQLFFRIISKLTLLSIFPSEPMFAAPMLKLLATLSYNLKNHLQKYKILIQIVDICLFVVQFVQQKRKKITKQKLSSQQEIRKFVKRWKQTHLGVTNTLNKISLVLDKYVPQRMLQNLEKCIIKLKGSNQYGIGPIINMVQANIYTNVSGQKVGI